VDLKSQPGGPPTDNTVYSPQKLSPIRLDSLPHLLSYRLVCKTWKTVCTAVLRQRCTALNISQFDRVGVLDTLCATFGHTAEQGTLPWSAIRVPVITNKFSENGRETVRIVEVLYQFLDIFGNHLKKVRLIGTSSEIAIEVLQRLHQLESITCKLAPSAAYT